MRDIVNDLSPWMNYAYQSEIPEERRKRWIFYKQNLDKIFETLAISSKIDYLSIDKISNTLGIMILTQQEAESRSVLAIDSNNQKRIRCMTVHKAKGLEFHTVFLPFTDWKLSRGSRGGAADVSIINGNEVAFLLKGDKVFENQQVVFKNDFYETDQDQEKNSRLREETRILYVAMTRAIKRLVFCSYDNNRPKRRIHSFTWQDLIERSRL